MAPKKGKLEKRDDSDEEEVVSIELSQSKGRKKNDKTKLTKKQQRSQRNEMSFDEEVILQTKNQGEKKEAQGKAKNKSKGKDNFSDSDDNLPDLNKMDSDVQIPAAPKSMPKKAKKKKNKKDYFSDDEDKLPDFNQPIESEVKTKSLTRKGKNNKKPNTFESQVTLLNDNEKEESPYSYADLSEESSDCKKLTKGEESLLAGKLKTVNLNETRNSETEIRPEETALAPPESSEVFEEEEASEDEETKLRKKKEAGRLTKMRLFSEIG